MEAADHRVVGTLPPGVEEELFKWALYHGVKCDKLNYPVLSRDNLLGFTAKEPIVADDTLMTVPARIIISKAVCMADPDLSRVFIENYQLYSDDEDATLVTFIVYHRLFKKEKSFWWPYLRALPDIDVLSDWSDAELEELQDETIAVSAKLADTEYELLSLTFVDLLTTKYPSLFDPAIMTPNWFRWGYKVVASRGFSSRLPEVLMIPIADNLNHGNIASKYILEAPSPNTPGTNADYVSTFSTKATHQLEMDELLSDDKASVASIDCHDDDVFVVEEDLAEAYIREYDENTSQLMQVNRAAAIRNKAASPHFSSRSLDDHPIDVRNLPSISLMQENGFADESLKKFDDSSTHGTESTQVANPRTLCTDERARTITDINMDPHAMTDERCDTVMRPLQKPFLNSTAIVPNPRAIPIPSLAPPLVPNNSSHPPRAIFEVLRAHAISDSVTETAEPVDSQKSTSEGQSMTITSMMTDYTTAVTTGSVMPLLDPPSVTFMRKPVPQNPLTASIPTVSTMSSHTSRYRLLSHEKITRGTFRLTASRDTHYAPNDDVLFSAGRRDNCHLMSEYGFSILDNEHDVVVVRVLHLLEDPTFTPPAVAARALRMLSQATEISTGPFRLKWNVLHTHMLTFFRLLAMASDPICFASWEAGKLRVFNRLSSGPIEHNALSLMVESLQRTLAAFPTTLEQDRALLAKLNPRLVASHANYYALPGLDSEPSSVQSGTLNFAGRDFPGAPCRPSLAEFRNAVAIKYRMSRKALLLTQVKIGDDRMSKLSKRVNNSLKNAKYIQRHLSKLQGHSDSDHDSLSVSTGKGTSMPHLNLNQPVGHPQQGHHHLPHNLAYNRNHNHVHGHSHHNHHHKKNGNQDLHAGISHKPVDARNAFYNHSNSTSNSSNGSTNTLPRDYLSRDSSNSSISSPVLPPVAASSHFSVNPHAYMHFHGNPNGSSPSTGPSLGTSATIPSNRVPPLPIASHTNHSKQSFHGKASAQPGSFPSNGNLAYYPPNYYNSVTGPGSNGGSNFNLGG